MVPPLQTAGLGQVLVAGGAVLAAVTVIWLSVQRRFDWLFFAALILLLASLVVFTQLG